MTIRLILFGGARLVDSTGEPCDGRAGQRRRLALLAILAAQRGEPIARERIVSLLWPDVATALGRRSLAESLHVIQKELGEDPVVRRGDELALDLERVSCDVVEFERAIEEGRVEEAVALYGGAFLAGLVVRDAPDFSFWADRARERLQDAFAAAVERAAERAEAAGAWSEAVAAWRRLGAEAPESTPVALRLARALDGGGDRAAALRHLQFHEAYLREVLELEPPEELRALEAGLRSAPRAPQAAPAAAAEPALVLHGGDDFAGDDEPDPRVVEREPLPPPEAGPARRSPWRAPRRRWAAAAIVGAAVLAAGLVGTLRGEREAPPAERAPVRVAVAGCVANGEDRALAGLCGGLMDLLTLQLAEVEALSVLRPLGSLGGGVPPDAPLDALAMRWGADAALAATLERSGGRIRHTLLLAEGAGGRLFADTLEVPDGEAFALEETLARRAANLLRRQLGRSAALGTLREAPADREARRLVMRAYAERGRALEEVADPDPVRRGVGRRRLARVDTLLMRAEARDGRWSVPVVLRGWTALARARGAGADEQAALLAEARGHADRAVARRAADAEARELRSLVLWTLANLPANGDSAEALVDSASADAAAAVDADESRVAAWTTLSQMLRFQGRHDEAYYAAVRAREMDHFLERDRVATDRLFRGALAFGRFDLAARHCADGARDHPDDWRFAECALTLLARTDTGAADTAAAAAALRRLYELDPPEALEGVRGYARVHRHMLFAAVLARAGHGERALKERAVARSFVEPGSAADLRSFSFDEAHLRLFMGDTAGAKRVLDELLAQHPMERRFIAAEYLFRGFRPRA